MNISPTNSLTWPPYASPCISNPFPSYPCHFWSLINTLHRVPSRPCFMTGGISSKTPRTPLMPDSITTLTHPRDASRPLTPRANRLRDIHRGPL